MKSTFLQNVYFRSTQKCQAYYAIGLLSSHCAGTKLRSKDRKMQTIVFLAALAALYLPLWVYQCKLQMSVFFWVVQPLVSIVFNGERWNGCTPSFRSLQHFQSRHIRITSDLTYMMYHTSLERGRYHTQRLRQRGQADIFNCVHNLLNLNFVLALPVLYL